MHNDKTVEPPDELRGGEITKQRTMMAQGSASSA